MKTNYYIFLLAILCLFTSCENRTCECSDDLSIEWEDLELENVNINTPNALLDVGEPLAIQISRVDPPLVWKLRYVKIYNDEQTFIETDSPGRFRMSDTVIEFPHEELSVQDPGPLSIRIEIEFQERGAYLNIDGTIYYYNCESITEEFDLEECRWPKQIIPNNVIIPC